MAEKTVINIARDFGRYPAGRYIADGPYNGQTFREKHLVPALRRTGGDVEIEFEGARGLGSSFLEEAFGGLVRNEGFEPGNLLARLKLQTTDQSLIEEIKEYVSAQSPTDSN